MVSEAQIIEILKDAKAIGLNEKQIRALGECLRTIRNSPSPHDVGKWATKVSRAWNEAVGSLPATKRALLNTAISVRSAKQPIQNRAKTTTRKLTNPRRI